MTKIEIEKPVLPDWIAGLIDGANEFFSSNPILETDVYEKYNSIKRFLEQNNTTTDTANKLFYIRVHSDDVFTAMMYGYEVED